MLSAWDHHLGSGVGVSDGLVVMEEELSNEEDA